MTVRIISENTKICTKCGEIKSFSDFNKNKRSKDGFIQHCRLCAKEYNKKYYKNNKDIIKNKTKQYRQNNINKEKVWKKEYYQKNKDKIKEYLEKNEEAIKRYRKKYNKEYYKNNVEKIKEYKKEYQHINKKDISRYQKKYQHINKEKINKCRKEYNKTEVGKLSKTNANHKRRLKKINTYDGTIPLNIVYPLIKEIQDLLDRQDNKCNICHTDITKNKHLDHYIPLSKGGEHSIRNVQFLCPSCNLKKGDSMPKELLLI